jgi:hypothetical protein
VYVTQDITNHLIISLNLGFGLSCLRNETLDEIFQIAHALQFVHTLTASGCKKSSMMEAEVLDQFRNSGAWFVFS